MEMDHFAKDHFHAKEKKKNGEGVGKKNLINDR